MYLSDARHTFDIIHFILFKITIHNKTVELQLEYSYINTMTGNTKKYIKSHSSATKTTNTNKKTNKTKKNRKRTPVNQHRRKNKKQKHKQNGAGSNKDNAKCNPSRLDDLLAGNPPVTMDQKIPKQTISVSDLSGINAKGLGKTPGPPPNLPSGCAIL